MIHSEPARTGLACAAPATGITVYGCGPDEAELFRELAPRLGARPTITAAPLSQDTVELACGNRCISVGHKQPIENPTLLALSRAGVEYISTRSIGYNHIDRPYAESVGLVVGNVAYSPDSVADYTVMLILMALRDAKSVVRRGIRHDYRLGTCGRELRDLTVGVVGTGRIGTAVVERLRGFGGRVLTFDKNTATSLEELLRLSDVVTLHIPLTAATRHLLDRRRLGLLKDGAVLVNTARGALIDTDALIATLESGRLGGAALDVVEGEEGIFYADCRTSLASDSLARLQALPNVLISPHTAYYTDHSLRDMVENSLLNCMEFEGRNQHG